jgi:molybdate transport system ATP-binding protein
MSSDRGLAIDIRFARVGADFALEVRFEAPPGITILFGPSGAGKSTTLAAIAGLLRPDQGRISLGDAAWFDSERGVFLPIHERGVAYVFQSLALFPHMTALTNVEYGAPRSMPKAERRRHAMTMLERMKVGNLWNRKPRTFSGGEAQRVALARAFAMSPRVVMLDEPFAAMDRALRREFITDVRGFAEEEQIPLLHVTHHINEARALGDRAVLLDKGRVVGVGPVRELLPREDAAEEDALSPRERALAGKGAAGRSPEGGNDA